MAGSIRLLRYSPEFEFDPDTNTGWGLLVRAEAIGDINPEIFVYHKMVESDPYTGDMFEAVSSINQYYELPTYAPEKLENNEIIPYYRRNQVELFARSPSELEEIWKYLQADIARLVRDYNSTEILREFVTSDIDEEGGISTHIVSAGSIILDLSWEPAGDWNGEQIANPDINKQGWLPISLIGNAFAAPADRIPENAIWFYNVSKESADFQKVFSTLKEPYSDCLLDINGVYLLYGPEGAYQVTKDTIFWMPNDNYQTASVSEHPWPDDYIPGVDVAPRTLRLTLSSVS
jgi:hypothetical protein